MGFKQGFKDLKFEDRNKRPFFPPADWTAGVDYDEDIDDEDYEDEDEEEQEEDLSEEDFDDEDWYDRVSQEELDALADDEDKSSPTVVTDDEGDDDDEDDQDDDQDQEDDEEDQYEESDEEDEPQPQATTRSGRATSRPETLKMSFKGKSYLQKNKPVKKVTCADQSGEELEICHNIIAQVHPHLEYDYEYEDIML